MDDNAAVVDLTDSPPLPATAANFTSTAAANANANAVADALVISSDDDNDDNSNNTAAAAGLPALPSGLVLPPLRTAHAHPNTNTSAHERPERILTLRALLSTPRRTRAPGTLPPRSVALRAVPPSMLQPPLVANTLQHS
ncbi:hypothetical protein IW150_004805, partial [Coemansia sp. RSA 2607]